VAKVKQNGKKGVRGEGPEDRRQETHGTAKAASGIQCKRIVERYRRRDEIRHTIGVLAARPVVNTENETHPN